MASVGAIANMSSVADKKLYQAMADINTAFPDVEPAILPTFRDPRYQDAARREVIAAWAERLAVAMGVSSVVVEEAEPVESEVTEDDAAVNSDGGAYDGMTKRQLRALANERGIPNEGLNNVAELKDALQAADGFTEDEQSQMDAMGDSGEAG